MRKILFLLLFSILSIKPATAQNLDAVIQELTKDVEGQVVTPATTAELQTLFKGATLTQVPRIFVDKLPADFAEKGSPELYTQVMSALILRFNEIAIKEKMLLSALKQKFYNDEKWSETEEAFFNFLVEKYDVIASKTPETRLDQLTLKVDEIDPALAVAQSVYATDWGTKNLNHPFSQMGWVDEKNYTELPFDSLLSATESYFKEMNGAPSYWFWRQRREKSAFNRPNKSASSLANGLRTYKPEDPYYMHTIQRIISNNKTLYKLKEAVFMEKE